MAESARHPLFERLVVEFGLPEVDTGTVDAFLAAPGEALLFFTEDPLKYPESADVAVVLPELLRALPGRFRAALVARESERVLQKRFGFARWPALVCLRDGELVGTLTGMHEWGEFVESLRALLAAPTRRELAAAAVLENARGASPEEPK